MTNSKRLLHTLRLLGFGEAISWLLLLFIAMPLKYLYDQPFAVRITGWVHGLLFVLYIVQLLRVKIALGWPFLKLVYGTIASFFPFGTLIFDRWLQKEEVRISLRQDI